MKKGLSKEVKIALATIASGLLLFFGINYLKGINLVKPANYYYTNLTDVTGLAISTPVLLDGFKVGLVNEMAYNYGKPGHIIVELSLDSKLKIPKGSTATMEVGLLGDASIVLNLAKGTTDMLALGDTIDGGNASGLMDNISSNILPQLESMLPRIDSILIGLQAVVTSPAIHESLDQLSSTTRNLEQSSRQLAALMNKDLPVITKNLTTVSSDFTQVSSNLKGIDFQSTMSSVDQSAKNLETLTGSLNNKNSSLGLLMNDRSLYDNLANTAENANALMLDLKENPKRYVHFSIW